MCDFGGVQRGNYFGGGKIRRTEIDVRVRKLKNGKDGVIGEMIKGGLDLETV